MGYYETLDLKQQLQEDAEEYGKTLNCYFDGCCEPTNPSGNIGWGFYIEGEASHCGYLPQAKSNTNNVAEYLAFYNLVQYLSTTEYDNIHIFGDSKMVVMQMIDKWKIKNGAYVDIAHKSKRILNGLLMTKNVDIFWIPREKNETADMLSKLIIRKCKNKL